MKMNLFIIVFGVVLTIVSVTNVDGRIFHEYDSNDYDNYNDPKDDIAHRLSTIKRDKTVSKRERDYLLGQIVPVLDNEIKQDFVHVFTKLNEDDRHTVAVVLSTLAWTTTRGCSRLKKTMSLSQIMQLTLENALAELTYKNELSKKLTQNDQQVMKSTEDYVKNNAQLLCK